MAVRVLGVPLAEAVLLVTGAVRADRLTGDAGADRLAGDAAAVRLAGDAAAVTRLAVIPMTGALVGVAVLGVARPLESLWRVRLGRVALGTLARVGLIGLAERTGTAGPVALLVVVVLPVTGGPVALLVVASLVVASLIEAGLVVAGLSEAGLAVIPAGGLTETRLVVNARPGRPAPLGRVVRRVNPARALVIAKRGLRPGADRGVRRGADRVLRPGADSTAGHGQAGLRDRYAL